MPDLIPVMYCYKEDIIRIINKVNENLGLSSTAPESPSPIEEDGSEEDDPGFDSDIDEDEFY